MAVTGTSGRGTGLTQAGAGQTARGAASQASRLPLSARQMLADRQRHAKAAQATGSVTGLVQAPDGEPLAGVCVTAYGKAGARLGVTSAAGRYFIPDLRLGAYRLRYASCQNAARYLPQWYGGAAQRARSAQVQIAQTRPQPLAAVTLRTPAEAAPTRDVISNSSPAATASSIATALGLASAGPRTFQSLTAPAAVAARDGRISGTVTAARDHKPLRGICVYAVRTTGSGRFTLTKTDKTGHYQTARVPAGRYEVAFLPGCDNKGNWLPQIYKSNTKPTPVRVQAGKTTPGINGVLTLGGEISGTIINGKGTKLGGICAFPIPVTLFSSPDNGGALLLASLASVRGSYHLRSLPGGAYKISFQACQPSSPYAPQWWHNALTYKAASAVKVKGGQRVTGINAVMHIGGVISGTVSTIGNTPIKGICVSANITSPQSIQDEIVDNFGGFTQTDAAGQYKLIGLAADTYQLDFEIGCGNNSNYLPATSASIPVRLGGVYSDSVMLEPGVRVTGAVTSKATGTPLAGACVVMWSDTADYDGGFAITGSDGSYVINNQVPPGTYYVAFAGGCGNTGSYGPAAYNSPSPDSPAPITATAFGQAIPDIDAALPLGATIGGTVTTTNGKNLTGICVSASGDDLVESVNGHYRMSNLQPGQYAMTFTSGCGDKQQDKAESNLVGAYFGSQLNPALVSAPAGNTFGIDSRLVTGGAISGKVRTKAGRAVLIACVALTGLSGAAVANSNVGLAFEGSYSFTGVVPGRYAVTFLPGCILGSGDENQWYKDKPSPAGAAVVKITAAHTTSGINGALTAGGSLAGTITSGGKPVLGMCVFAQNVSQFLDSGESGTNKAGHYVITGLNSGRYELEMLPCSPSSQRYAGTLLSKIVKVTAPRRTGSVNATATLGGTLTGTVQGDIPVTPQSGICVDAFAANGDFGNSDVTVDGGGYSITNLPAGKYFVFFNDPNCAEGITDLAPQWYPAAPTQAAASTVTVSAAATTTLPSNTLPQDGAIAGTVSATGHGPLSGACVIVTSSLPGQPPVYSVSRGNGGYQVVGLAPGKYEVEFSSGCGATGYKSQWWQDRNVPFGVTLVPVTAAATTSGISATLHK